MTLPDLNLLVTLDVLLTEGSVARAAERLRLSPSAMSRALARLRAVTGDPLLVRAGRGLVLTPRAMELRQQVGPLVQQAQAVLRPAEGLDLSRLQRSFTLRTREGFVESFGATLLTHIAQQAPGVRLHFLPKPDRDSTPLREGRVDLETGVIGPSLSPEVRAQALFRDRFIGVVRPGHPLSGTEITLAHYLAGQHIALSRQMHTQGPVDLALHALGCERAILTTAGSFSAALALAAATDAIATVPERHTANLRAGLHSFPLPFTLADFTVSLLWHPRMDADPAHRWLRGVVRAVCG